MNRIIALGFAAVVLGACGDDGSGGSGAVGGQGGSTGGSNSGAGGSGGSGGEPSGSYTAVHDTYCAPERLIGTVQLSSTPDPYVQVYLYDKPDPWIGPPELETATCAFHRFNTSSCATQCSPGDVCSFDGDCVPERRTVKDATLTIDVNGAEQTLQADETLGGINGNVTVGSAQSSFGMSLTWGALEVVLEPMPYMADTLQNLTLTTESDQFDQPGAVDVTWDPAAAGHVMSTIPINHHAAGPTFTHCVAAASLGAFHADAEMINPLSVITGLEFQGVQYVSVAAAETPAGCVEFRFGGQQFPN
ncbi:MAG: hypothetical protein U0271_14895 [Polyangiaceae bacterium]